MREAEKTLNIVDDFENYLGESALLENTWATNFGPGCSLKPTLSTEEGTFNSGKYGLAFNYKLSNEKTGEGWVGMTIPKEVDWSEYDALQLWVKPDGNGQKLVIQITSNGEDFEVWLPEFAMTTEAQLITLPFSEFKGKNNGTFDASNIQKVGIWCNTLVPEGNEGIWTVESTMYFDDIKAINTADIEVPEDDSNKPSEDEDNNGSNQEKPEEDSNTNNDVVIKPSIDKPNNNNKLPQTGGSNSIVVLATAMSLIGSGSIFIGKRRKKDN